MVETQLAGEPFYVEIEHGIYYVRHERAGRW